MAYTLTLPTDIGPNGGVLADGVYRGYLDRAFFEKHFARNFSFSGAKYYTIDASSGVDVDENDITAQATGTTPIQLFPTNASGNLSQGDSLEFGILKVDYDAGRRVNGLHVNVDTPASSDVTFGVYYFATDDTWKQVTGLQGINTFLKISGDNHITFNVPPDHQSLVHVVGTQVTRVYPYRVIIESVTPASTAPTGHGLFVNQEVPMPVDITTVVQSYDIFTSLGHISTGDNFDHISPQPSSGVEYVLTSAQVGGGTQWNYWNGGQFVPFPDINDPSNGLTRQNNQSVVKVNLTANVNNAVGVSTLSIEDGGYVKGILPSATNEASIGLVTLNGLNNWMFGINATGQIVATENGNVIYTHPTAPTTNTELRVWWLDKAVRFYVGNDHVFASTNVPTQNVMARFTAATSGTQINNAELVQFAPNEQDATPVLITMQVGSGFNETQQAPQTIEYPARYVVKWSIPSDWVANTAENSPDHYPGYTINTTKTGNVTKAIEGIYAKALLAGGVNSSGVTMTEVQHFTRANLKLHDAAEWTQNIVFSIINANTNTSVKATFVPKEYGEGDVALSGAINYSVGDKLILIQVSGRNPQYIRSGDIIIH